MQKPPILVTFPPPASLAGEFVHSSSSSPASFSASSSSAALSDHRGRLDDLEEQDPVLSARLRLDAIGHALRVQLHVRLVHLRQNLLVPYHEHRQRQLVGPEPLTRQLDLPRDGPVRLQLHPHGVGRRPSDVSAHLPVDRLQKVRVAAVQLRVALVDVDEVRRGGAADDLEQRLLVGAPLALPGLVERPRVLGGELGGVIPLLVRSFEPLEAVHQEPLVNRFAQLHLHLNRQIPAVPLVERPP
mmetsp:Transcript_9517/g.20134  ORF Transcript_9517/g.20134 Transcript_9517/m.20134 type:complete len:243 (+) Transcript_9517:74-802(+)